MKPQNVILSVAKNLLRMQVTSNIRQRFLVVILLGMTVMITPVFAAESTPSADVKSKLEELKKDIASRAAKLKLEVNRRLQNKSYVGNVKAKSQTSLTLATRTGPKIITLNQDTIFESNVKTKKFSGKTLAEEDYLAALGDVDEIGILTARKIILLPKPKEIEKTYLWGKIISISDDLVTLKNRDLKNIAVSLTTTVKLNDFVILTGTKNENDIFEAEFVYVIPQGGFIKPKKVVYPAPNGAGATQSAKPTR